MEQSKIGSLIEALLNTVIGFSINWTANMLIFPLFGFHITARANFMLGLIYTVISVARSYCVRRWFNAKLHAMSQAMASKIEASQ